MIKVRDYKELINDMNSNNVSSFDILKTSIQKNLTKESYSSLMEAYKDSYSHKRG